MAGVLRLPSAHHLRRSRDLRVVARARKGSYVSEPVEANFSQQRVLRRVERSGSKERPNHSDLCTSEFRYNFYQNSGIFSQFFRNSENVETSQHFLECSAKSGEKNQNLINFR